MLDLFVTIHVIVCVFLIFVILFQKTSSDGISNISSSGFGGFSSLISQNTANNFLYKLTIFFAICFVANSVFLANMAVKAKTARSVTEQILQHNKLQE